MSFTDRYGLAGWQSGLSSLFLHYDNKPRARLSFVAVGVSDRPTHTARSIAALGQQPVQKIADLGTRGSVLVR